MPDKHTEQRLKDLRLLSGSFEKGESDRKQSISIGIGIIVVGLLLLALPFISTLKIDLGTIEHWGCIVMALAAIGLGIFTLKNVGGSYEFTTDRLVEKRADGKTGTVIPYKDVKSIRHHGSKIGSEFLLIVTNKVRMSVVLTPEIFEAIETAKQKS